MKLLFVLPLSYVLGNEKVHSSPHQRNLNRRHYWSHLIYFEVSVIASLSWYIQTALVHCKQIPSDQINLEALMPFVQIESIRLFNNYYRTDESSKFQVADLLGETKLNGLSGKILSYNQRTQLYNVLILSSLGNFLPRELSPEVMEPCYLINKVKKGSFFLSKDKSMLETIITEVTIPNPGGGQQFFVVKFHLKVFELMMKKFVRPDNTSNGVSVYALKEELTKIDKELQIDKTQSQVVQSEFDTVYNKLMLTLPSGSFQQLFKIPFFVADKSLHSAGNDLREFDLLKNSEVTCFDVDDLLYKAFSVEGLLSFSCDSYKSLKPGIELDDNIVDLCLKW